MKFKPFSRKESTRPNRRGRLAAIVLAVMLVAGLATGATFKIRHDNEVKRERAAVLAAKKKQEKERQAAQAEYDECSGAESDLISQLEDLTARLDVGLNYADYTEAVGDVSVAYKTSTKDLDVGMDCLSDVAVPAEAAVNQFVRAARKWSDCFDDIDCDTDEINLQGYWSKASSRTDDASSGLVAMEPG